MSLDLHPLAAMGDWVSPYEHLDPDEALLQAVPADEQPVGWDDDAYDRDEVA